MLVRVLLIPWTQRRGGVIDSVVLGLFIEIVCSGEVLVVDVVAAPASLEAPASSRPASTPSSSWPAKCVPMINVLVAVLTPHTQPPVRRYLSKAVFDAAGPLLVLKDLLLLLATIITAVVVNLTKSFVVALTFVTFMESYRIKTSATTVNVPPWLRVLKFIILIFEALILVNFDEIPATPAVQL